MRYLIYFLASLLFLSCNDIKRATQNRQKRKLEKWIQKYSVGKDTIVEKVESIRLDTIIVPSIEVDTVFNYQLDTTYIIEQSGVRTELKILRDTVNLFTKVLERDTIVQLRDSVKIIRVVETVDVTQEKKPCKFLGVPCWLWLIIAIGLPVVILIIKRK